MSAVAGDSQAQATIHVAVDVGGTFTDVCALDGNGELSIAKLPSTPNPIDAVLDGVRELGVDLHDIALFAHGTTVATNALITRNLPRAAMVVTAGFRDVLEIRRGTREDLWDVYKESAAPYIRRRDRLGVSERVGADGEVLTPLDEAEARRVAQILGRRGIESVAVCFVNSFTNPSHEQRMKEILEEEIPGVAVSTSSEVLPEIFEHERFSTTVSNTVLGPVVSGYVSELDQRLRDAECPGQLLVLHCGGGVMTPEAVERLAARLASSGIAAGAIAARHTAKLCGYENGIGLDMGGTSADISLVYEGELRVTRGWSVEYGYPILFPSIEVLTIGAGGGSIAWIDDGGSLRNGPRSAGATPGPACYGRGGDLATNTDANVVLGRLGEKLVGGAMELDGEKARAVIASEVAEPLDLELEEAANAVIRVANANMADAVRLVSIGRGYDPRDFPLIAFGGAGSLHGVAVARDLGIPTVIVPPHPGITSALGCLLVDIRHDLTKMLLAKADESALPEIDSAFAAMESQAAELLAGEGVDEDQVTLLRGVDMRYAGQWRSITVNMPPGTEGIEPLLEIFHNEYEREHNYRREDGEVEIYQLHLTAIGATKKAELPRYPIGDEQAEPQSRRRVVFDGGTAADDTPIYWRPDLLPGAKLIGPVVVEQLDSTTLIPPGAVGEVDEWLNLRISVEADER